MSVERDKLVALLSSRTYRKDDVRELAVEIAERKGEKKPPKKWNKRKLAEYVADNFDYLSEGKKEQLLNALKGAEVKVPPTDIARQLAEVRRELARLRITIEKLVAKAGWRRTVSLREFASVLVEEYWRLNQSGRPDYVPLSEVKQAVVSRLGIPEDVFDQYLSDLRWVSDKITLSRSRRTVHILIDARNSGDLIWR